MKGHLIMSSKERRRLKVLTLVKASKITLKEASFRMDLSYRQTLRVYHRYCEHGDAGLVHRSRGKPSNKAYSPKFRQKSIKRYEKRYDGFGPTLAAEKLAEEGICVDHETLRRWLLEEGLWKKRRKSAKHRTWRERRKNFGALVQMDGSHHNWFGQDKPKSCLLKMIDDATGRRMTLLAEEETTKAAMHLLWNWIEKYGVPVALYTDRKNVYVTDREPTLEEELDGEVPATAFGKSCQKLGIKIIAAHSPQAKGRVERSNGVYQDRFVKELALRRIITIATANKLLRNGYEDELNAKFSKEPMEKQDYHTALGESVDLNEIFCFEEIRTVQNDWTIRYENRRYQITKDNRPLPKPKDKVMVRKDLCGAISLVYRDNLLDFNPITARQLKTQNKRKTKLIKNKELPKSKNSRRKPASDHPWRRFRIAAAKKKR